MKKLTWLCFAVTVLSCNNGSKPADASKDTAAAAPAADSSMNYPYTIEHPDYWQVGDPANAMTVLSSLKKWEEGKMDEAMKYFADSIYIEFDGLDKKMSNDSLKAMFASGWNEYKTVTVKMEDFESMISKDKKEEWVTMWYKQTWETKKGVKGSAAVVNDAQLQNGKIIRLDEYTRKLH